MTSIKVKSLLDPRESAISGHILMEIAPYGPLIHEKKDERSLLCGVWLKRSSHQGTESLALLSFGFGGINSGWVEWPGADPLPDVQVSPPKVDGLGTRT